MRVCDIKHLFAMTLILLLASAIGGAGLNADVIWADELYSVTFMGAFDPPYSLSQVMESLTALSPDHVPLYYLLGAAWSRLVGWSQLAMRYFSLLAGVMMIAWLYRFVRDNIGRRTAIVAAFVMATNTFVMIYFHELRGYTLLLLFIIIHSWLYWRLIRHEKPSLQMWGLFVALATVILYTHALGLVMLIALGAAHLLVEGWSSRSKIVLAGWAAALGLLFPYLPTIVSGGYKWGETESALLATELAEPVIALLTNGLGVLALPLALILAYQMWRKRNSTISSLVLLAAIYSALILVASWLFDLITLSRIRYFLVLWFPCMILIAYSVSAFSRSLKIVIVILAVWALAGLHFGRSGQIREYATFGKRTWQYPPLHEYTSRLQGKVRPGDYLVGFSASLSVNENGIGLDVGIADYYLDAQLGIDGVFLHTNLRRYRLEEDLRSILEAHPLILLAHDPSNVPLNYARTLATVQDVFASCNLLVDEQTLSIRRYAHPVMGCDHEAAPIKYDNDIKVVDRAVRFDPDVESIESLIWWDVPDEAMLEEYNISLQIITSDGRNVRQTDRHLNDKIVPWSVINMSTDDLPSDSYQLVLILYHREHLAKVAGIDLRSATASKILHMAYIGLK